MNDSPNKHQYLTCLKCNKKSLLWDVRCKRFLCMGKDCAASFRLGTVNDADQDIVGRMQHALEDIDGAIMPADQREADAKAVGGPVSPYCVDYDEQGVVERVRAFAEAQAAEIERLRALEDWVMAFQDGCEGISLLANEMIDGRVEIEFQAKRIEKLEDALRAIAIYWQDEKPQRDDRDSPFDWRRCSTGQEDIARSALKGEWPVQATAAKEQRDAQ